MWCNYYAVTFQDLCVYIYREYLQLCPLAYESTSLLCLSLFAASTWGAVPGSYLVVTYCTWTSDGLRKHVKCTVLSRVHLQYFWKVCVIEEGTVTVSLVCSSCSQSVLCGFQMVCRYITVMAALKFTDFLINRIRFCYKWLWSFFNWHCGYFVWPWEQIIKKPAVPTKRATVSFITVKSCDACYLCYW
jgi:hypothetical protein